ncbi:hypothetical protein NLJ89_g12405 [Agrocybe chaxingu]|uniref:Uncharacterized protein n=1 Tax=Agrocybe chaxingu TaxID=84603 RepID=A0A9W8JN68_9AGAR|nr:hypothetical protein NLJ89_g12405 [Agrocybe chaxingu]
MGCGKHQHNEPDTHPDDHPTMSTQAGETGGTRLHTSIGETNTGMTGTSGEPAKSRRPTISPPTTTERSLTVARLPRPPHPPRISLPAPVHPPPSTPPASYYGTTVSK